MDLPSFSEERLNNIVRAFTKRSKALKHHSCSVAFEKELEDGSERLNIDCDVLDRPPIQVRLSVWTDGVAYFRTCQSAKQGWRFNIQLSGTLIDIEPIVIEERFEDSIRESEENRLLEIWKEFNPYQ